MEPIPLQSVRRGDDGSFFDLKRGVNSGEPSRRWALVTQIKTFIQKIARADICQCRIKKQSRTKLGEAIPLKRARRRVLRYRGREKTCGQFFRPKRTGHGRRHSKRKVEAALSWTRQGESRIQSFSGQSRRCIERK